MRRAIALACTTGVPRGPNPRVGAVLLGSDGDVIAEGFHRGAGSVHAEVDALQTAGPAARGATAVVTLEPCNHTGRTGPCAQALVAAGVSRVVYAQRDSTSRARGGEAHLRGAGLDVESGLLVDDARAINRAWTFAVEHRRPFVTWKFATTLDGRSAAPDGTSMWISGEPARRDVHRLRAECDAVLVGTGTVLADNPRLTVRDELDQPVDRSEQPLRVVMGLREIPDDAAVRDDTAPTLQVRSRKPTEALDTLFDDDRHHVWLEGGPTLAAEFLKAGLVDEIVAYVSPVLLGGGPSAVGDLGVSTLSDAFRFPVAEIAKIGDDARVTLNPLGTWRESSRHSEEGMA
jgi:diaminohydroxyphosphoribosylaminopyrimidine deaminase / 5-amino-6-(5-phosphoribosylamino)uracil reductase